MLRMRWRMLFGVAVVVCGPVSGQPAPCEGPTSRDPAWFPDGDRLAFVSDRTGHYEVWVVNADGTNPTRVTRSPYDAFYPAPSPDGRHIAFSAIWPDGAAVALVSAEGGDLRLLTDARDEAGDPSWFPDGDRLVYSSRREGTRDLWSARLPEGGAKLLFHLEGDEWAPRVSPTGDRILFHSNPEGNFDVFAAALDGRELRNLTQDPAFDGVPTWSPDGDRIAYYRRVMPLDEGSEAHRASWAGAEIRTMLAQGAADGPLTLNGHLDQSPAWSPDGRTIAYTSCASGNREVWLMSAAGGDPRRLTHTTADSADIVNAVRRYVFGWQAGDVASLRETLAAQGTIVWIDGDTVSSITFEQALANRRPNPGYGVGWKVLRIDVVDETLAVARVRIPWPEEGMEYTDVLTLYRIDGRWRIVNKAYTSRPVATR